MAKLNLLIDGNYFLYKLTFILFKEKVLYSALEESLHIELNKLTKLYPFDNIYFVTDDIISWRKKDYNFYKANRTKEIEIDWDYVYKVFNEFKKILNDKPNINMINVQFAEGDDLFSYIINESNKKGYSNLLVASDGDLYQFLDYNLKNNWINIMYNNKLSDETVYLPENYKIFLQQLKQKAVSGNFFDDDDDEASELYEFFKKFLTKAKNVTKDKEETLFIKVISGDKGDNISSVYENLTTTGKIRGIGSDGAKKLYSLYKETYPEDVDFINNEKLINRLKDIICYWKKINTDDNIDTIKTNIEEKIKRNLRLIVLNKKYQPDWLYENMTNSISI